MPYRDQPHKLGRPRRAQGETQTISLRLTFEEIKALTAQARRRKATRSEVVRDALEGLGLFTMPVRKSA